MSDVPSDLYRIILLHLPAESLLRFRAVCRSWCFIIDDPSFIKLHTLTQQSSSNSLLITDLSGCRLYSLSLHSLTYSHHTQQTVELIPIKSLIRRNVPRLHVQPQQISCHGLILLYLSKLFNDWVVWNPLTRDFHRLFYTEDIASMYGVGLGYDYSANDYKVVTINEIYREGEYVFKTRIYSLKSRTWKVIKDCPSDSIFCWSIGVYLNGALHWITKTAIMALDIATEEYRLLPLPPHTNEHRYLSIYLYALDGCLFIKYDYMIDGSQEDQRLDVWIMKDEISVETPWIKLLSLVEEDRVRLGGKYMVFGFLKLVAYSKSRGEVIMKYDNYFFCFNIRKNCVKKVTIDGLPRSFGCQNFQGSLVRLVDDDGETTLGAKKKRKRKNKSDKRCKLSVTVEDL